MRPLAERRVRRRRPREILVRDSGQPILDLAAQGGANIDLVAREFYSFCPDIVDQGVGELEALYPVVAGPDWGFWWD